MLRCGLYIFELVCRKAAQILSHYKFRVNVGVIDHQTLVPISILWLNLEMRSAHRHSHARVNEKCHS